MTRIDRRRILQWCTAALTAGLAGCTGGGDDPGPTTVTGLDVDCATVEARRNPPYSDLTVFPNPLDEDVEIDLDHAFPEGGVYLKRNGEAVDAWNPNRAPGARLSLDPSDDVVIVVEDGEGNCTRWEGVAADLER